MYQIILSPEVVVVLLFTQSPVANFAPSQPAQGGADRSRRLLLQARCDFALGCLIFLDSASLRRNNRFTKTSWFPHGQLP
jgi:hypothetical protein